MYIRPFELRFRELLRFSEFRGSMLIKIFIPWLLFEKDLRLCKCKSKKNRAHPVVHTHLLSGFNKKKPKRGRAFFLYAITLHTHTHKHTHNT